jgi:hypothetical protein
LWKALLSRKPADDESAVTLAPDLEDAQGVLGDELSSAWFLQIEAVNAYLEKNGDRLLVHLLVFAGLAGLLVLLNRRRAGWPKPEGQPEIVVDVVSHPFATAALIALFMTRYLYPGAPLSLFDVSRLLLVIPILILLQQAFSERRRFALYALLSLFVIDVVRGLLQTQPLSSRTWPCHHDPGRRSGKVGHGFGPRPVGENLQAILPPFRADPYRLDHRQRGRHRGARRTAG